MAKSIHLSENPVDCELGGFRGLVERRTPELLALKRAALYGIYITTYLLTYSALYVLGVYIAMSLIDRASREI
jgi:hypothetical protein